MKGIFVISPQEAGATRRREENRRPPHWPQLRILIATEALAASGARADLKKEADMDTQIGKAWKSAANIGCALVMLLLPFSPARGDAVSDWNAVAAHMAGSSDQSRAARELATVYTAMFEAMNFVEGKYVPCFLVKQPAPLGASGEIEAIGAAHYVLAQLHPDQKAALDAALERSLAAFPDWDAASRARIWGRHLGGNVYALVLSALDRPSNRTNVPTSGKSKLARTGGEAWNSIATRSIEGRTLQPIERARIHALVSLAASEAYSAADGARESHDSAAACGSCAVGAAIRVILEAEFGLVDQRAPGSAILTPVRNDADESWSAKAGEEVGRKIGLQVLTYYRRIK